MTASATCDRAVGTILGDETLSAAGLSAHLAACDSCRALADAHAAAMLLRQEAVAGARPIEALEVRRCVRRRRFVRVSLSTGAVAAVAVATLLVVPVSRMPPEQAQAGSVLALLDVIDGYASRDLVKGDDLYAAFAPLPAWLAPPHARASNSSPWPKAVFPWEETEDKEEANE